MWNLKQFGEVSIFDRKMPTAPDLRKRMKFWHFLKVLPNSWNLQNLLESPPGTCMCKFEAVWRSFNFWQKNADSARTLEKGWNFDIFSKVSKIHETYRIYWNHLQEHACEIWRSLEKFQFLTEKCRQLRTLEKGWTFDIFSKFSKIHETYRIYWNHLQEHACAIWSSLEKFQFLTEKCRQRRTLEKGWTFDIFSKFSKIHETYRIYWNHLQEHACEIWSSLEKFQFLTEKCRQRRTLEKGWNFDILSKFSEIHETYRIYWNHLQEHACEIWSSLEKFQFLTEKCRQCRTLEKGWNFDILSKFSKIHETYRIYWNHLQGNMFSMWNLEAVWRSFNFWQKNADSAGP